MKRTYEAMVLLDNREVKRGWQNLKDEVCALFVKHGAEVKSAKRWDERRLAFPIKHQLRGTYMLVYFESETGVLAPIRRDLDYCEPVLRHLTQVCEAIPESAFEPEAAFDETSVRVEDTGSVRGGSAGESEGEAGGESAAEVEPVAAAAESSSEEKEEAK